MKEKRPQQGDRRIADFQRLRERAERMLDLNPSTFKTVPAEKVRELIHELHVYQIELEIQNEELLRVRDELEDSRDRYAKLYDFAPVGYMTLDTNGTIKSANLTLASMIGIERGKILGQKFIGLIDKELRSQFYTYFHQFLDSNCTDLEIKLNGKKEEVIWTLLQCAPEFDGNGDVVEYRMTVTDISARKRAGLEMVESNRALRELTENLEQCVSDRTATAENRAAQLRILTAELIRTEQRERRRLAQILHDDLQQLLAAARLNLGILNSKLEEGENRKLGTCAYDLLEKSLDCSRLLTRELSPPVLAEGGLHAALEWCSEWAAQSLKLDVSVSIDPSAEPENEDDRYLLFSAVRELLLNVRKHARVDFADLTMQRRGDDVCITVADEGSGFDSVGAPLQGEDPKGYGLFSIEERLEALGGSVRIESAVGKGTRVSLFLPLKRGATESVPSRIPPPRNQDRVTREEG